MSGQIVACSFGKYKIMFMYTFSTRLKIKIEMLLVHIVDITVYDKYNILSCLYHVYFVETLSTASLLIFL